MNKLAFKILASVGTIGHRSRELTTKDTKGTKITKEERGKGTGDREKGAVRKGGKELG